MKTSRRLLAGLAGAALAGTALTCSITGAAHASPVPSSLWQLDFHADSTVLSDDGHTLYAAALDFTGEASAVDLAAVDTTSGAVTEHTIAIGDLSVDEDAATWIDAVAVSPDGTAYVGVDTSSGYGVVPFDASTGVAQEAIATTIEPNYLAADDGQFVFSDGEYLEVGAGDPVDLPVAGDDYPNVQRLAVHGNEVAALGGDDFDAAWTGSIDGGSVVATRTDLDKGWMNVAIGNDGTVYVGESYDIDNGADTAYQVQVLGSDPHVIPVDDITHLALTGNGAGLYAGDQTVNLADDSTTDVNWPAGSWSDTIAVGADAVYVAAQLDSDDDGTESIVKLTSPAAATQLSVETYGDGEADLQFTAPAQQDNAPDAVTYTVTATATDGPTAGQTITAGDVWNNDGDTWEAGFWDDTTLTPGTTYRFSVRSDNGAFVVSDGALLTALAKTYVTHPATITVAGTLAVGNTLSIDTHGGGFGNAEVGYLWVGFRSNDDDGTVIGEGATLALTPAMQGLHVELYIEADPTDAQADQLDSYYWDSGDLGVVGAAASQTPVNNNPPASTQPPTVGAINVPALKAGSKKLTLTLVGVHTLPGKVKVYDGKKLLGSATVKNGKLVLKLRKKLKHGRHHLKLSYAGSSQLAGFTKKVSLKVK